MSNNKPMCDDTLANKGAVDPNEVIGVTDEQLINFIEWTIDEYHNDYEVDEELERIKAHPHDVGFIYTTFDDYDDDDNMLDEHEIQISMDLVRMVWTVEVDWVLIHEEPIQEDDFDFIDFDSYFSYFMQPVRAWMSEHRDELMELEASPADQYDSRQEEIAEKLERAKERYDRASAIFKAINERFSLNPYTAWDYANAAADDGKGIDDIPSILHDIQDDLRPERNY